MRDSESGQLEKALRLGAGRIGFEAVVPNPKLKLLDQVREVLRLRHYSIRTEQSYCGWIRRYIRFRRMEAREELLPGTAKVEAFLSDLAVNGQVAAAQCARNRERSVAPAIRSTASLGAFACRCVPHTGTPAGWPVYSSATPPRTAKPHRGDLCADLHPPGRKPASTGHPAGVFGQPLRQLLGRNDVSTTMIYTQVLRQGGSGMKSPLDCLQEVSA